MFISQLPLLVRVLTLMATPDGIGVRGLVKGGAGGGREGGTSGGPRNYRGLNLRRDDGGAAVRQSSGFHNRDSRGDGRNLGSSGCEKGKGSGNKGDRTCTRDAGGGWKQFGCADAQGAGRRRRRRGGGDGTRGRRPVDGLVDIDADPQGTAAELSVVTRAGRVAAGVDDRAGRVGDVAAEALEARLKTGVVEAEPDARVNTQLDGHVQPVQSGLRGQGARRVCLVREAAQEGPARREDYVEVRVSHIETLFLHRGRVRDRDGEP